MTPDQLTAVVADALADSVMAGDVAEPGPVDAPVRSRDGHEWSTPIALRVAAATGMPVGTVAAALADRLATAAAIETVSVREGFITVTLRSPVAAVDRALAEGEAYGDVTGIVLGPPQRWVSAAATVRWTLDNPVLLVQLARVRLAADLLTEPGNGGWRPDPVLTQAVGEFPALVRRAVTAADPDTVARFLERVARRAIDADALPPDLREAVAVVLGNGLGVLGTAAPARV